MSQKHSHPVLRQPSQEKKSQPTPTPTPQQPSLSPTLSVEFANPYPLRVMSNWAHNIEEQFPNKGVLYIGSEQYDPATITILEGLSSLGFTIYTLHKPNINSWFCNTVVSRAKDAKFDFVLSNLGWGVRWSNYGRYQLNKRVKVLIDSDSNELPWRTKVDSLDTYYNKARPTNSDELHVQPHPWAESHKRYSPDLTFACCPVDGEIYLPTGIQKTFSQLASPHRNITERTTPIAAFHHSVPEMDRILELFFPGIPFLSSVQGEAYIPIDAAKYISEDSGFHGWDSWIHFRSYFQSLSDTTAVIYANQFGAQEPWEALACGCLLFLHQPDINLSSYPLTALSPFTVFKSPEEAEDKFHWLTVHPDNLARMRQESTSFAEEFFTPTPLAKRFLWYVYDLTTR